MGKLAEGNALKPHSPAFAPSGLFIHTYPDIGRCPMLMMQGLRPSHPMQNVIEPNNCI
jgi:hypothetical protein